MRPEITLEHLKTELVYRQEQIAKFRDRDRTVEVDSTSEVDPACVQKMANLMHQYGAGAIDFYVDWLKDVIKLFEQRVNVRERSFE